MFPSLLNHILRTPVCLKSSGFSPFDVRILAGSCMHWKGVNARLMFAVLDEKSFIVPTTRITRMMRVCR